MGGCADVNRSLRKSNWLHTQNHIWKTVCRVANGSSDDKWHVAGQLTGVLIAVARYLNSGYDERNCNHADDDDDGAGGGHDHSYYLSIQM